MGGDGHLHVLRWRSRGNQRQGARGVPLRLPRHAVARLVDAGADRRSQRRRAPRRRSRRWRSNWWREFGAPSIADATAAAEEEFAFAASLCDHPLDMLVAVHRTVENSEIREAFRTLRPRGERKPMRAFSFLEVEGEEEPGEIGGSREAARRAPVMHDFWLSCGHHLLDRDEGGGLRRHRRVPQGLSGAAGARAAGRTPAWSSARCTPRC